MKSFYVVHAMIALTQKQEAEVSRNLLGAVIKFDASKIPEYPGTGW
jgi:hypothetical protein